MSSKPELTEEAGYEALRAHLLDRALLARHRYGPGIDQTAILHILQDRDVVRFPTVLRFGTESLYAGEFAHALPLGDAPTDGFALVVHPHFRERPDDIGLLAAYHLVSINYLDVATHEEAELFGAALHGIETDEYYERVWRAGGRARPCAAMIGHHDFYSFSLTDRPRPGGLDRLVRRGSGAGLRTARGCRARH